MANLPYGYAMNGLFRSSVFSCDVPHRLLPHIAATLLRKHEGADPLALADAVLMLPSRRACAAMAEAILAVRGGSTLMPRIYPLADMDEGFAAEALLHAPDAGLPAIDGPHRLAEISRMVWRSLAAIQDGSPRMEQASAMAQDIIRLMDEMDREMIGYDALLALRPEHYARHWQERLHVLHEVLRRWPARLAALGMVHPMVRRNAQLLALARQWTAHPPAHEVYLIGSTGSQPATRQLMKAIAALPQGGVYLSQLDVDATPHVWQQLEPSHPQWLYRQLLQALERSPESVEPLTGDSASTAMRHMWRRVHLPAPLAAAYSEKVSCQEGGNIHTVPCDDSLHEALVITLLMVETLHRQGQSVAFISQDSALIDKVLALLSCCGVVPNVGIGASVLHTQAMQWLLAVWRAATQSSQASAWLAMMRHPFSPCEALPEMAALRDVLEVQALRGVRFAPEIADTLTGWLRRQGEHGAQDALSRMQDTIAALASLSALARKGAATAQELWQAHVQVAATLAGEQWPQPDWLQRLDLAMAACGQIAPASYEAVLEHLAQNIKSYDSAPAHPRVHVLSPIEARLMAFDRVILGGMTEGVWPTRAADDGWLNDALRQRLGLPPHAAHIGQQALDMMALASSAEVYLTQARQSGGEAALPSRWLQRAQAAGIIWQEAAHYAAWARELHTPSGEVQTQPPAPLAWENSFPSHLWATHLDQLQTDPYGFYARHILKLKALDALDQQPDAATYGSMAHMAWQRFIEQLNQTTALPSASCFLQAAHQAAERFAAWPVVRAVWQPRLAGLAADAARMECGARSAGAHIVAEQEVQAEFADASGEPFYLHARIDRLEHYPDGRWHIVDYKTGAPPKKEAIEQGYACQLPAAALAVHYAMGGEVGFAYWKLGAGPHPLQPEGEYDPVYAAPLIDATREGLATLVGAYRTQQRPFWPTPVPGKKPRYNDYEHLARSAEWAMDVAE